MKTIKPHSHGWTEKGGLPATSLICVARGWSTLSRTTYSPSSPPPSSPATSATSASAAAPSPSPTSSGSFSAPSPNSSIRATSLNGGPPSPPTEPSAASSSPPAPSSASGSIHTPNTAVSSSSRSASSPSSPAASSLSADPPVSTPVFEITARPDGSMQFFLHGHEGNSDFLHPGSVNSIDPNCNILFLEVEPCQFVSCPPPPPPPPLAMPFNGLDLEDEQMLLELVADQVRLKLPDSLNGCFPLFFPQSTDEEGEAGGGDLGLLEEHRSYLINMYNNLRGGVVNWQLLPGFRVVFRWKPDSEENSRSPDQFCLKLQ